MNYIITFLISMIPLVELRGAVPYAISSGIPLWQALLIGVVGNMLPVPIIFFFARHIQNTESQVDPNSHNRP